MNLFENFVKLTVKFTQNLLKIFYTFFNLRFFEFRENLQKILINYLEIELNFTNNYSEIFSKYS